MYGFKPGEKLTVQDKRSIRLSGETDNRNERRRCVVVKETINYILVDYGTCREAISKFDVYRNAVLLWKGW